MAQTDPIRWKKSTGREIFSLFLQLNMDLEVYIAQCFSNFHVHMNLVAGGSYYNADSDQ